MRILENGDIVLSSADQEVLVDIISLSMRSPEQAKGDGITSLEGSSSFLATFNNLRQS